MSDEVDGAMNAAVLAAMSTPPPTVPRYAIRALPERGKWVLLENGIPRWTGERVYLETLMRRLQAVDAVLVQHGIDPASEPEEKDT